jgi:hypothetical protein
LLLASDSQTAAPIALGTSLASVDPKATAAFECYVDLAYDTRTAVVEEYVDDDTTKLAHG